MARLGAEAAHALGRIVAGKRGEVDAGHRLHEPGGLVFLLDRAAGRQRRGAALDRARVDADVLEPIGRPGRANPRPTWRRPQADVAPTPSGRGARPKSMPTFSNCRPLPF